MFRSVLHASAEKLLRAGYARSGATFRKVVSSNALIVNFQKSSTSSSSDLKFTINLGVVLGHLLDPERSTITRATLEDAHVRERVGALLPGMGDLWWDVNGQTHLDLLTKEISDLIVVAVIPHLDGLASTEAVERLWKSGRSPGLTGKMRERYLDELHRSIAH
jgi:hypothetical protein